MNLQREYDVRLPHDGKLCTLEQGVRRVLESKLHFHI
jgi:hypothetical protein